MRRDHYAMQRIALDNCQVCNSNWHLARHHIVNRALVQNDDPENLIVLCQTCHDAVHAKALDLGIYLTASQAAKAVLLMGTLSRAYHFLYPSESPKRLRAA